MQELGLTPPANREEAVTQILHSGMTMSAMLAVAYAFPLPGEIEETDAWLERLRAAGQADFVDELFEGRDRYLTTWGVEAQER